MTRSIVPIVEGQGEVGSIPVLMRRLIAEWSKYELTIARPVRVKRYQVVKEGELERRVQLAMTRPSCQAVIIILDADDDCPKDLGVVLLQRAKQVARNIPVSVVLPKSELESWFISSIESLQGIRGIMTSVSSPSNPESVRDAKRFLTEVMGGHHYSEVDDQPAFAAQFDLTQAHTHCRSFRKFYSDFYRITHTLQPQN